MNAKARPANLSAATVAAIAAAVQEQGTSGSTTTAAAPPAIGSKVMVVDPQGALQNPETGQRFEAGVPTPQRVTVLTWRRLKEGSLTLAD